MGSVAAGDDDGVVVDVVCDEGVLYLELINLAPRPALEVECRFEPTLVDAAGRDVSELALFRRLPFLAPGRRIRTLLDSHVGYFGRGAPVRFDVTVEYERPGGERCTHRVAHDLDVFRGLAQRV